MKKAYLNKSIKDFRKTLETVISEDKRKMQDIEIQNTYYRELANVSRVIENII